MNRIAGLLVVLALLAAGCGQEDLQDNPGIVPPVAEPIATDTLPTLVGTEAGVTIVVVLEDNVIGMPTDRIPVGPVVFTVRNAGTQLHSFAIVGGAIDKRLNENLSTNEEGTMEVIFEPGTYRAFCPLHEEAGDEVVQFEVTAP
ncbi:MAG: hypothetical protein ACRD2J_12520 [Thermoanaerobaculia bacterium]